MKQSRLMSLLESLANVLVGYVVAVFPLFGLAVTVTVTENLLNGLIFTVVSIVRSYALRRGCEALRVRQSARASSTISQ